MREVRARKLALPVDIMTVGLYGLTHRYVDPDYECINFLDSSGQQHVGEHNSYNLGKNVAHLPIGSHEGDERGGMAFVADLFADGKNPLEADVPKIPEAGGVVGPLIGDKTPSSPHNEINHVFTPSGMVLESLPLPKVPSWPKGNNSSLIAYYGDPEHVKMVDFEPPFQMIDEDTKKPIKTFQVHPKCLEAFAGVFAELWLACGKDQKVIEKYHLHIFSGSYNKRYIRGLESKHIWSNHAFGAAIDFYSQGNPLGQIKRPPQEYMPDFAVYIWTKRYKARWGGNYIGRRDWMHFEFCQ